MNGARIKQSRLGRYGGARPAAILIWAVLGWAMLAIVAAPARGDGGHIALHQTEGAYTVTLFTSPNPLVPGRADLSLLVEDAETGAVIRDASAEARLERAGETPIVLALTQAGASNPLLLAGSPVFAAPGSYRVTIRVTRPGGTLAGFQGVLAVEADHRRRTTLLFAFLLPMVIVAVFLLNQHAKRLGALRRVQTG